VQTFFSDGKYLHIFFLNVFHKMEHPPEHDTEVSNVVVNNHEHSITYYTLSEESVKLNNYESGFFSQCTLILCGIVDYINYFKKTPQVVNSSNSFIWYKPKEFVEKNKDITLEYFDFPTIRPEEKTSCSLYPSESKLNELVIDDEKIDFYINHQWYDYRTVNYSKICPIINKFFSPSLKILNIIKNIENKYNFPSQATENWSSPSLRSGESLNLSTLRSDKFIFGFDGVSAKTVNFPSQATEKSFSSTDEKMNYENICVLFYRGNDKAIESKLCGYEEYVHYSELIYEKNPNIQFLIQSDETEFIEFMTNKYPNNSFYFKDEIRHIKKQMNTVDKIFKENNYIFSKYYLAITIMMSKCKYIICGSGNCSIWIMLYRGNSNNICQNINGKWIDTFL
jgi:hypothetical protein